MVFLLVLSKRCWRWQNTSQKIESKGTTGRKCEAWTFTFLERILPTPTLLEQNQEKEKPPCINATTLTQLSGWWFQTRWFFYFFQTANPPSVPFILAKAIALFWRKVDIFENVQQNILDWKYCWNLSKKTFTLDPSIMFHSMEGPATLPPSL